MANENTEPKLKEGWRVAQAQDGKEYYYNENTGETSWDLDAAAADDVALDVDQDDATQSDGTTGAATNMPQPRSIPAANNPAATSNTQSALQPYFSKLLVVFVCSFIVMLQASIRHAEAPSSELGYAVSVGVISLIGIGALLLVAHKSPEKIDTQVGRFKLMQVIAVFLFIWWFLATIILTFPRGSFQGTTFNTYFALWSATLSTIVMCIDAFGSLGDTYRAYADKATVDTRVRSFVTLFFCSLVLAVACIFFLAEYFPPIFGPKPFEGHAAWGLTTAIITLLIAPIWYIAHKNEKLSSKMEKILSIFVVLLWLACTITITFDGPFSGVSNGFFAGWIGLATTASLCYKTFHEDDLNIMGSLKQSLSVGAGAPAPTTSNGGVDPIPHH